MTRGSPTVADAGPRVGDAISHYRLIGGAGDGDLGRLFVAAQRKIRDVSNTVALRSIRPELAEHPDFFACFTAAASVVPRLEHPNILSVHEMGAVDGCCFFSMEYLAGEDVAAILTRCNTGSPVPPDIAAAIVKQAANAVHYVHTATAPATKRLLGYGEIGSSSLFVTYHGTVKWLVTGLRALQESGPAASGEHELSWSSAYRPPEQGPPDARSDVFSLGALLWTFLTGHRPQRAYPGGELDADALGRGVAPSSIQPAVPEALDAIVMRALALDPDQRFQSVRELSEALDRHLLQCDARPTHKHIRRWMTQLFDAERASLQLQIARGRDVEAALASLASLQGGGSSPAPPRSGRHARELWSTRHSSFARPERTSFEPSSRLLSREPAPASEPELPESPPTFRAVSPLALPASVQPETAAPAARLPAWVIGAGVAACAVLGVALFVSSRAERALSPGASSAQAEARGQLEVQSLPEGASIFIDGEPTGLRTPAVLKSLAGGRTRRVRVEKAGFASQEREVAIAPGAALVERFELQASRGSVLFAGAPQGARIFIDDARVPWDGKPLSLPVGEHAVRVEAQNSLIFAGDVVVVGGEQTIRVGNGAADP